MAELSLRKLSQMDIDLLEANFQSLHGAGAS